MSSKNILTMEHDDVLRNYCPFCKAYSGKNFEIIKKGNLPEAEKIKCTKCQNIFKWSDCKHFEDDYE